MTTADDSGDAHMFTQRLAALAAARGVMFLNEARILALEREGDRISGVRVEGQVLKADAYVVSLGNARALADIGHRFGPRAEIDFAFTGRAVVKRAAHPRRAPRVSPT